jgi:hypothetical protein
MIKIASYGKLRFAGARAYSARRGFPKRSGDLRSNGLDRLPTGEHGQEAFHCGELSPARTVQYMDCLREGGCTGMITFGKTSGKSHIPRSTRPSDGPAGMPGCARSHRRPVRYWLVGIRQFQRRGGESGSNAKYEGFTERGMTIPILPSLPPGGC